MTVSRFLSFVFVFILSAFNFVSAKPQSIIDIQLSLMDEVVNQGREFAAGRMDIKQNEPAGWYDYVLSQKFAFNRTVSRLSFRAYSVYGYSGYALLIQELGYSGNLPLQSDDTNVFADVRSMRAGINKVASLAYGLSDDEYNTFVGAIKDLAYAYRRFVRFNPADNPASNPDNNIEAFFEDVFLSVVFCVPRVMSNRSSFNDDNYLSFLIQFYFYNSFRAVAFCGTREEDKAFIEFAKQHLSWIKDNFSSQLSAIDISAWIARIDYLLPAVDCRIRLPKVLAADPNVSSLQPSDITDAIFSRLKDGLGNEKGGGWYDYYVPALDDYVLALRDLNFSKNLNDVQGADATEKVGRALACLRWADIPTLGTDREGAPSSTILDLYDVNVFSIKNAVIKWLDAVSSQDNPCGLDFSQLKKFIDATVSFAMKLNAGGVLDASREENKRSFFEKVWDCMQRANNFKPQGKNPTAAEVKNYVETRSSGLKKAQFPNDAEKFAAFSFFRNEVSMFLSAPISNSLVYSVDFSAQDSGLKGYLQGKLEEADMVLSGSAKGSLEDIKIDLLALLTSAVDQQKSPSFWDNTQLFKDSRVDWYGFVVEEMRKFKIGVAGLSFSNMVHKNFFDISGTTSFDLNPNTFSWIVKAASILNESDYAAFKDLLKNFANAMMRYRYFEGKSGRAFLSSPDNKTENFYSLVWSNMAQSKPSFWPANPGVDDLRKYVEWLFYSPMVGNWDNNFAEQLMALLFASKSIEAALNNSRLTNLNNDLRAEFNSKKAILDTLIENAGMRLNLNKQVIYFEQYSKLTYEDALDYLTLELTQNLGTENPGDWYSYFVPARNKFILGLESLFFGKDLDAISGANTKELLGKALLMLRNDSLSLNVTSSDSHAAKPAVEKWLNASGSSDTPAGIVDGAQLKKFVTLAKEYALKGKSAGLFDFSSEEGKNKFFEDVWFSLRRAIPFKYSSSRPAGSEIIKFAELVVGRYVTSNEYPDVVEKNAQVDLVKLEFESILANSAQNPNFDENSKNGIRSKLAFVVQVLNSIPLSSTKYSERALPVSSEISKLSEQLAAQGSREDNIIKYLDALFNSTAAVSSNNSQLASWRSDLVSMLSSFDLSKVSDSVGGKDKIKMILKDFPNDKVIIFGRAVAGYYALKKAPGYPLDSFYTELWQVMLEAAKLSTSPLGMITKVLAAFVSAANTLSKGKLEKLQTLSVALSALKNNLSDSFVKNDYKTYFSDFLGSDGSFISSETVTKFFLDNDVSNPSSWKKTATAPVAAFNQINYSASVDLNKLKQSVVSAIDDQISAIINATLLTQNHNALSSAQSAIGSLKQNRNKDYANIVFQALQQRAAEFLKSTISGSEKLDLNAVLQKTVTLTNSVSSLFDGPNFAQSKFYEAPFVANGLEIDAVKLAITINDDGSLDLEQWKMDKDVDAQIDLADVKSLSLIKKMLRLKKFVNLSGGSIVLDILSKKQEALLVQAFNLIVSDAVGAFANYALMILKPEDSSSVLYKENFLKCVLGSSFKNILWPGDGASSSEWMSFVSSLMSGNSFITQSPTQTLLQSNESAITKNNICISVSFKDLLKKISSNSALAILSLIDGPSLKDNFGLLKSIIDLQSSAKTIIEELGSGVDFSSLSDFYKNVKAFFNSSYLPQQQNEASFSVLTFFAEKAESYISAITVENYNPNECRGLKNFLSKFSMLDHTSSASMKYGVSSDSQFKNMLLSSNPLWASAAQVQGSLISSSYSKLVAKLYFKLLDVFVQLSIKKFYVDPLNSSKDFPLPDLVAVLNSVGASGVSFVKLFVEFYLDQTVVIFNKSDWIDSSGKIISPGQQGVASLDAINNSINTAILDYFGSANFASMKERFELKILAEKNAAMIVKASADLTVAKTNLSSAQLDLLFNKSQLALNSLADKLEADFDKADGSLADKKNMLRKLMKFLEPSNLQLFANKDFSSLNIRETTINNFVGDDSVVKDALLLPIESSAKTPAKLLDMSRLTALKVEIESELSAFLKNIPSFVDRKIQNAAAKVVINPSASYAENKAAVEDFQKNIVAPFMRSMSKVNLLDAFLSLRMLAGDAVTRAELLASKTIQDLMAQAPFSLSNS